MALTLQSYLWSGCAVSLVVAGIASLAERRRANRRDLDKVGFMPWPFITIMAMMVALSCMAIALKAQ